MNIFQVTFSSGKTMEEYGDSAQDVREFIARSYSHMGAVASIVQVPNFS